MGLKKGGGRDGVNAKARLSPAGGRRQRKIRRHCGRPARSAGRRLSAPRLRPGGGDKFCRSGQKAPDHRLVFAPAQRAGGVDQPPARPHPGGEFLEQGGLAPRIVRHGRRRGRPLQVRLPAPGARTGAGGVDEDPVVGRSQDGGDEDAPVGQAGAAGAAQELIEGLAAEVEGIHPPGGAEEAG